MPKPVVNLADVPMTDHGHGNAYAARLGSIGPLVGAQKLGCRITTLPPGKKAFPFHAHHANEEMFFVLEDRGRFRHGAESYPVGKGDVVCARAGGAETAHQFINDSEAELTYLAVSTMLEPDVMEYPDSGKVAVFAGAAPGGDKAKRTFSFCARTRDAVDYWEGEEG
jgi:uncharacterized cupin superfamily protein